jgi:hypothetical protein
MRFAFAGQRNKPSENQYDNARRNKRAPGKLAVICSHLARK